MTGEASAWVPQVLFGWNGTWVAALILLATYTAVILDRLNIAVVAMAGASAMVLVGVLSQEAALRAIDFNTIALLIGMMIMVALTGRTGVFQYLAIRAAKLARASPAGILVMLQLITAVVSALLDNVTTVLLVAPVTLLICEQLGVKPFGFLVAEIFASNIGGTGTLIGDPPNILIGSSVGLSFNDFLVHVLPCVIAVQAVTSLGFHLIYGRRLRATPEAIQRIMNFDERRAISDRRLLLQAGLVLSLILSGFISARYIGLEVGTIAAAGATLLMILHLLGRPTEEQTVIVQETLNSVDWTTIFFFIGLFVVVYGIEVTGLLDQAARWLMASTGGEPWVVISVVLFGSALISSIVNNIPYVAAMIPLIKAIGATPGSAFYGGPEHLLPLWWALALGACLGGNGTLIGASANLAVAGLGERAGAAIHFVPYAKIAFPLMLLGILISLVYLYLRYL